MARKIGYIRAIGSEAALAEQREALTRAGCAQIFEDSGQTNERPAPRWRACMESFCGGDRLVVPSLGHLGFTLEQLAEALSDLVKRDVELDVCVWRRAAAFDTPTFLDVVQQLDAFERAGRRELINAGLSSARAKGRVGGRRHKLTPQQVAALKERMAVPGADPVAIGKEFGLGRASVYKYLKR